MIRIFELTHFSGTNSSSGPDVMHRTIAALMPRPDISWYSLSNSLSGITNFNAHSPPTMLSERKDIRYKTQSLCRILTASMLSNVDILHSMSTPYLRTMARVMKKRNRKMKHILTVHGTAFRGKVVGYDGNFIYPLPEDIVAEQLMTKSIPTADKVTAVSFYTAEEVKERYGVDCLPIATGIPVENYKHRFSVHDGPIRILFVGTLKPRKQPMAVARLAKDFPDMHFIIKGRGPLESTIRYTSSGLKNLQLDTRILPPKSLNDYYSTSDIFVFPSIHEGCAQTLKEAAASGLPIIAANASSNPEVVEDEKNGFLCKSYADFVESLENLRDENLRRRFSGCSRKKAEEFDWRFIIPKYEEIFRSLA